MRVHAGASPFCAWDAPACHSSIWSRACWRRQRIVYARNTFANCGVDRDSFLRQLETSYRKALSGVFLPDTFKFNSRWNNQGGLNEQKQAVWAHSGLR